MCSKLTQLKEGSSDEPDIGVQQLSSWDLHSCNIDTGKSSSLPVNVIKILQTKVAMLLARGYLLTDFEFVFVVSFHLKLCIGSSLASTASYDMVILRFGERIPSRWSFPKDNDGWIYPPTQDGSGKSEFMWIPY